MSGQDIPTIIRTFFSFMTGMTGIGIMAIILAIACIRLAAEHRFHHMVYAVIGCMGFFSVAWIMNYFFGASV